MDNSTIEYHPFEPFIPCDARLLMLGSFPPGVSRWTMDFFYPNWINDMWRIMGILFYDNKDYFCNIDDKSFKLDEIKTFLNEKKIALYDTARAVIRLKGNASDKYLKIQDTIDLKSVVNSYPTIDTVITTGQKAAEVIASLTDSSIPAIGLPQTFVFEGKEITHYWMPSSSRAYPMNILKKAQYYSMAFEALGYDIIKKNL